MSVILTVILFACILTASVFFSALGQGGGAAYTPIQVLLGVGFHTAATTSLFLIMVTSLSATIVFRKAHKIDWPLATAMETVTISGALIGGLVSGYFSQNALSVALACVLAVASAFMIGKFDAGAHREHTPKGSLSWQRDFDNRQYSVNLLIALPASFTIGALSGMLGIGGGIIKVPVMVVLLGIPIDIAVGSSAFMVGLTALGGFTGHIILGHWNWRTSLLLALAVFIGGQVGARWSVGIRKDTLEKLFGWFLLTAALFMIIKVVV